MSGDFDFIGLEIHSRRMWQAAQVKQALDFMEENGFNALIFHQSDMMNRIVLPKRYISVKTMWEKFCALRYFDIESNQHYINLVIKDAKRRGIGFYLNVKEIFYPDEIPELFPFLVNKENGVVCPTDPFWYEYIESAVEELCEAVPELAGLILSVGTHESRTSITRQNPCGCPRCRRQDPVDWYRRIFNAVLRPLKKRGKDLIIRDFTFTRGNQSLLLQAAGQLDGGVGIALKNTPHDYYPTFPNNPRIGTTGHREYVEFDTWGQFFGGGFFPVSIAEDIRQRLRYCRDRGARGILCRTDWEGMYENSTFNSCNMINLYAAGLLANDPDADLDEAYRRWGQRGWIDPMQPGSCLPRPAAPSAPDAWERMRDFARASWEVMRKTVYVRGHWFCEDNMFPDCLDKAEKMMVKVHGRDEWESGASDRLDPLQDENLAAIYREKDQALAEVQALRGILAPEACGFDPETVAQIDETLRLYTHYVQIGLTSCHVVFDTKRAALTGAKADIRRAEESIGALLDARTQIRALMEQGADRYPHMAYWLLNERRMGELAEDARRILAACPAGREEDS